MSDGSYDLMFEGVTLVKNISVGDAYQFAEKVWPKFLKGQQKWVDAVRKAWGAVPMGGDGDDPEIIALEDKAEALSQKYVQWVVKELRTHEISDYLEPYEPELLDSDFLILRSNNRHWRHEEYDWNPRTREWEMDVDIG